MKKALILILLVWIIPVITVAQSQNSVEGDRQALVDLYNATNGNSWNNNSGWLNGNPSSNWYGVEVDSNGRVTKLDLYKNNLQGSLPTSIGNLSELRFLSLKGNSTLGEIPQSIENWISAEVLLFSSDQANTPHNMPNEVHYGDHTGKNYNVSRSKYTGDIPDVFDNMPNLRILQLAWQKDFNPAPFPSTLYQHSKLEILELQGTRRNEPLLDNFNLPEMRRLAIGDNPYGGQIPSSLSNSTKVINFRLHNNDAWLDYVGDVAKYSGGIPASWSSFTQIRDFYLGNHNLEGELPSDLILGWDNLQFIMLTGNNFSGSIPAGFGDKDIRVFELGDNNFSGELPLNVVQGMPNIINFDVRENDLSGIVHAEWWATKTQLRSLNLSTNNFSGPLPEMPDYVGDLAAILLYSNQFEGGIPDSWENAFDVVKLNEDTRRDLMANAFQLHNNRLDGILPVWFSQFVNNDGTTVTPQVGANKWTHRDILENNVTVYFSLWPRTPKPFGEVESFTVVSGATFTYDYSARVLSTDDIQWTKDGSPISGATSAVLSIENFSSSDEGEYRLELTNTAGVADGDNNFPSTVVSEPIEIRIGVTEGTQPSAPVLSSPENNSGNISTSPTLSWNSVQNADHYRMQLSRNSGFSDLVTDQSNITSTVYTQSGLSEGNTYYWRVRAVNSDGSSSWSSVWNFTTEETGSDDGSGDGTGSDDTLPAPVMSGPSDNAQNVSLAPQFSWESVDGADYYILHASSADPSVMVIDAEVEGTEFTPQNDLAPETLHHWRVRAVKEGAEGEWSPIWEFTTKNDENGDSGSGSDSDDAPVLLSPGQDAKNLKQPISFEWEAVNADHYQLQVVESGSGNLAADIQASGTSHTLTNNLAPKTIYLWRVRAVIDGEPGEWSETWEFTTESEEEIATEVELEQNYPNPFNPSTQIRFTISEAQNVSLKVYDLAGRQVSTIVDGMVPAGSFNETFNADGLASGIYFYRMVTETEIISFKMTLTK